MNNLENIFNEELDLDEGIFSNALGKVKKNVQRGMDMTRAVNAHVQDVQRKADHAMDDTFRKMNAKTDTLNDKQVQIFNDIKKKKKNYIAGVQELIKIYDNLDDEDLEEKVMDVDFRAKLKELKSLRKEIEIKTKEGGFKIKPQTKKMFEFVKNNKIEDLKKLFKNDEKKKSSGDITTADAKGEKDFSELDKVYAAYKTSFSNIFGTIEESIFARLSIALNEEVDAKKWTEAMKFYKHYYNPTGDFHDYLIQWNKQTGGKVKKQLDAFLTNASKEQRAEFDEMIKARDIKKSKEKPAEEKKPELDTLGNEVTDALANMGFNKKQAGEVVRAILKANPDVKEPEVMRDAIVKLASGKVQESLNEMTLANPDKIVKNFRKVYDSIIAKKNGEKSQSIIKKKIATLQKMYTKSSNQAKFRQYVDKALKTIGITPKESKMGINATKILGWLEITKNSSLKTEDFNLEFELYKEDIVDILWDVRYKL